MTELPDPVYRDELVTLYHGDATELVPRIVQATPDVAIATDPPYGISVVDARGQVGSSNLATNRTYLPIEGDHEPFDPGYLLDLQVPTILWGGNYYPALPPSSRWLIWDKLGTFRSSDFADAELAWTNLDGPVRIHRQLWRGMIGHRERVERDRFHPTQKPLALMRWCVTLLPTDRTVLDPYAGSGSTLRAAKDLGRPAIGVEIERSYCDAIADRLAQETLPLDEPEPIGVSGSVRETGPAPIDQDPGNLDPPDETLSLLDDDPHNLTDTIPF